MPNAGISKSNSMHFGIDRFPDNQRRMWTGYLATVTYMDEQVGRMLSALKELGLDKETLVLFTSDHGYLLGEHHFWQKGNLREEVTRVTLIIRSPGMKAGASSSLQSTQKSQTGVSWYPKVAPNTAFGSGRTHQVEATASALLMAIDKAQDGDTLELANGHYIVPKLIVIDKTLTLKARHHGKAKLSFERTALFEIHDGGNLSLHGLTISGQFSPDSAGNSVVRTKKWE